jgi:predicted NUDIX family NTP pyrophosphohydrolase
MSESAEIVPVLAAGVVDKAMTTGRILMVKRTDTGEWAFPGGRLEGDETAEQAAYRETVRGTYPTTLATGWNRADRSRRSGRHSSPAPRPTT